MEAFSLKIPTGSGCGEFAGGPTSGTVCVSAGVGVGVGVGVLSQVVKPPSGNS